MKFIKKNLRISLSNEIKVWFETLQ